MKREHSYKINIIWTGNKGTGTSGYTSYDRSHSLAIENKKEIECSSDPAFRGDKSKINPEELLVSAISSCHMLWYLHLCADHGIIVTDYKDTATGIMQEMDGGGGHFTEVTLHPVVTITNESQIEKANDLHKLATKKCFITSSCNFPVLHQPVCLISETALLSKPGKD